ncbi:MAG: HAMP domain-containing histidine kinase [Sulfurimonas sp.]|nr:HAMP domain-containing histidine kinase [Sulfurimonas sp.]
MMHKIEIKIILSIVFFTIFIIGLERYQLSENIMEQFIESKKSKNNLLIDTIAPIVSLNLSLGLEEAYKDYLKTIAEQNYDLEYIKLIDISNNEIYKYIKDSNIKIKNEENDFLYCRKDIIDSITEDKLATITLKFSNKEYMDMINKNRDITINISIVTLVLLIIFILFIKRVFKHLNKLTDDVLLYDPKKNNFDLAKSTSNDEVGLIHNAIISMVSKINLHTNILDELNASLEDKVKEEVEKNRLQDQKLIQQSKMALMGEMISMIAHQWRQPLNIITLNTVKLETDILLNNKISNEEIHNVTSEINKQSQYLSNTIDDFRYFYKPNKKLETVKLEDVISKSLSIIKASLISSNIEIIEEYKSKEEIELYDNEVMQVIINILKNAQDNFSEKALKDTAPHNIKDPYIKITTENRTISICDNGGGIPENIIEKIFDPYFSTKDEKNSTGLGLYMSKTIIEKHHGGRLHVENRSNAQGASIGVCFVIEI